VGQDARVSEQTTLHPVTPDLHPLVERLGQLYRHDLSEFRDSWPDEEGTYRFPRLTAYLSDDPDRQAWLIRSGEHVAGFAFVRGLTEPARHIGEFFVVRRARRRGVGHDAALQLLRRHPGPWRIAFQDENPGAARFWRRVATDAVGDAWHEERLPVPDKPWLPPDVWLSLDTGA